MASSNLYVTPLKPGEGHLYQAVRRAAFKDTIMRILHTREPGQATLDRVDRETEAYIENGKSEFMACWDPTTGEIIAGSKTRFFAPEDTSKDLASGKPGTRTWEEVDAELTIPEPYEESDPEIFKYLFGLFNQNKREIMQNRPYIVLDTLVTHPDHHRKGAGGLLLKDACGKADARDVEMYLEASPMGAPLYERFGFQKVKVVEFSLGEGASEPRDFQFILMRRPAKSEQN